MSVPIKVRRPAGLGQPRINSSARVLAEARRGLRCMPKTLPAALFYDAAGSELFRRICDLPEYYLTRSERVILRERAGEIAERAGRNAAIIEYGSGAGEKVRFLLDAFDAPAAYIPIDVAAAQMHQAARDLRSAYPYLPVQPIMADYTQPVRLPAISAARRVAFFPGSTIGNFHPDDAAAFLRRIRRTVGADGMLVLGMDRVKDPTVLEAAYNDAAGVTAAFNRNLLVRLNREAGADFDPDHFEHWAPYDPAEHRIEMHLVSTARQVVRVGDDCVQFGQDESIRTECSYKYDDGRLKTLAAAGGFTLADRWTDPDERFWVAVLAAS